MKRTLTGGARDRTTMLVLAVLAGLFFAGGCASEESQVDEEAMLINSMLQSHTRTWDAAPEYIVEPPDRLVITVKDNPDLRTEAVVRPDGRVAMALVGDVFVSGKTVTQIEQEIEAGLARYIRNPNATVGLTAFLSKKIFVYGEVQDPGDYPYTGRDTVIDVIAQAGTLNWRAAPNGIQVTRGDPNNPTILPVRLKDIVIDDDDITNYYLQANDIIWVPPTTMVKIGDIAREIFWPAQWLLAPANVYSVYDSINR